MAAKFPFMMLVAMALLLLMSSSFTPLSGPAVVESAQYNKEKPLEATQVESSPGDGQSEQMVTDGQCRPPPHVKSNKVVSDGPCQENHCGRPDGNSSPGHDCDHPHADSHHPHTDSHHPHTDSHHPHADDCDGECSGRHSGPGHVQPDEQTENGFVKSEARCGTEPARDEDDSGSQKPSAGIAPSSPDKVKESDKVAAPEGIIRRSIQGLDDMLGQVGLSKEQVMKRLDTVMDRVSESKVRVKNSFDSLMVKVSASKDKVMEEIDHVIDKVAHSKVMEDIRALPGDIRESFVLSVRNRSYVAAGVMVTITTAFLVAGALYYAWCHQDSLHYRNQLELLSKSVENSTWSLDTPAQPAEEMTTGKLEANSSSLSVGALGDACDDGQSGAGKDCGHCDPPLASQIRDGVHSTQASDLNKGDSELTARDTQLGGYRPVGLVDAEHLSADDVLKSQPEGSCPVGLVDAERLSAEDCLKSQPEDSCPVGLVDAECLSAEDVLKSHQGSTCPVGLVDAEHLGAGDVLKPQQEGPVGLVEAECLSAEDVLKSDSLAQVNDGVYLSDTDQVYEEFAKNSAADTSIKCQEDAPEKEECGRLLSYSEEHANNLLFPNGDFQSVSGAAVSEEKLNSSLVGPAVSEEVSQRELPSSGAVSTCEESQEGAAAHENSNQAVSLCDASEGLLARKYLESTVSG